MSLKKMKRLIQPGKPAPSEYCSVLHGYGREPDRRVASVGQSWRGRIKRMVDDPYIARRIMVNQEVTFTTQDYTPNMGFYIAPYVGLT